MSQASAARKRRAAQAARVQLAAPVAPVPPLARQAPPPDMRRWTTDATAGELKFSQIASILQQAERGDTVQYADLTRRMLDSDDHLCSVYETRVDLVAGSRWKLNPGEGDARFAAMAAEDCRRLLESLGNVERFFSDIVDADWTGWSICELGWVPRGDMVWLDGYDWLHPRRFRFNDAYQPYLYDDGMAPRSEGAPSGTYGSLLARDKYVVHMPRVLPNYVVASGLARAVVRYWWVKTWATKFALGGAEIGGNPRMWGLVPEHAPADVVDAMYEGLQALSADGIGVFKAGSSVEINAPLAQGSSSVWDFLLKRCDAGFSKAILGSTLNVEVGDTGGAYSAAEAQGDVTILPRIRRSSRSMWSTIERDVFRPFLTWNRHRYGGAVPPIPRGESILIEDTPTAETVTAVVAAGGRVRQDELRTAAGLEGLGPENGGNAFVVSAATASPVAAIGGLGGEVEAVADTALNGAQIDSLSEIISNVAAGLLPKDSAIELITVAFPSIPRERAEAILRAITPGAAPVQAPSAEAPAATPLASTSAARPSLTQRPSTSKPWLTAARLAGSDATETSGRSRTM